MKIVVNALSARLGGGQTYIKNLLEHLPAMDGLEVIVFVPPQLQIPVHPAISRASTGWPTSNPLLRSIWERFGLPAFLRRVNADVLFCPGGVVATKPPRRCKVVTMFRNMSPFDERLMRVTPWGLQKLRLMMLKKLMLKSMTRADLTVFISDYARSVIEQKVKVPNPVTIPHGISDAFRSNEKCLARPGGLQDGEYLLYVSRFDLYKHHHEVVAAYASLSEELRSKYRLLLVGETNLREVDRIRRQVTELRLERNVVIAGAIPYDELPAVYRNASAILFASSCENCPNILLESLGSGRPVLSSDVMPMPEFGGPGLQYFSPFDPASIASALRAVIQDEGLAKRVGEAAVAQSLRYDWARTAHDTWSRIIGLAH